MRYVISPDTEVLCSSLTDLLEQGYTLTCAMEGDDFHIGDNVRIVNILCEEKPYKPLVQYQTIPYSQLKPFVKAAAKQSEETMNTLTNKILQWGIDRNITLQGGTTPQKQVSKLVEELAECIDALDDLEQGINSNAEHNLMDAYGDMMVCIIQACRLSGFDVQECLQMAYDEIKDRKGTMINGKFVKEA